MSRRTSLVLLIATAATVVAVLDGPGDWLRRRVQDPVDALRAAEWARQQALRAGAPEWATSEFSRADSVLYRARRLHRREQLDLLPFRNFPPVRDSLEAATALLADATALATAVLLDTSAAAHQAIQQAERDTEAATHAAAGLPLSATTRAQLAVAEAALAEARLLLREDRPVEAVRAAGAATDAALWVVGRGVTLTERFADDAQLTDWRSWIETTVAWSRSQRAVAIVVVKDRHELWLFDSGRRVRTFPVDLGPFSVHDKVRRGDRATPEGRYHVVQRKNVGESRYHRALLLDYPNQEDHDRIAAERSAGGSGTVAGLGGAIEIHGSGGRDVDWTDGCVALTDTDMDWVFDRVPVGTPVTIVGGDGTGALSELARRLRDGRQ